MHGLLRHRSYAAAGHAAAGICGDHGGQLQADQVVGELSPGAGSVTVLFVCGWPGGKARGMCLDRTAACHGRIACRAVLLYTLLRM